MAVSDGVFDEGTFDNATFNNVSRGEQVSSLATASSESDLSRSFDASAGLTDILDSVGLFRSVSASLNSADSFSRQSDLRRSLPETLELRDNESFLFSTTVPDGLSVQDRESLLFSSPVLETDGIRVQDTQSFLLNIFAPENMPISDKESFLFSFPISQSFSLDDLESDTAEYLRTLSPSFLINDSDILQTNRPLEVSTSVSASADRQSEHFRTINVIYSLSSEVRFSIFKTFQEEFGSFDELSKDMSRSLVALSEVSDELSDSAELFRILSVSYDLNDSVDLKKLLFRTVQNSVQVSGSIPRKTLNKFLDEELFLSESAERDALLLRDFTESPLFNDSKSFLNRKSLSENSTISDSLRLLVSLRFAPVINAIPSLDDIANLSRSVGESVAVSDSDFQQLSRQVSESEKVNDSVRRQGEFTRQLSQNVRPSSNIGSLQVFKELEASIVISDELGASADFFRAFTESFEAVESAKLKLRASFEESFSFGETISKLQERKLVQRTSINDVAESFVPAQKFASAVDLSALRRAVVELEKLEQS